MSIESVEISLIPPCSWHRAEEPPKNGSRIGAVVVELTPGESWKPGVNWKRGKSGVALRQGQSAEKPQQTLLSSRDCHSYHSLSDLSELAFSLCERSSSEKRTRSAGVIEVSTILRLWRLSRLQ